MKVKVIQAHSVPQERGKSKQYHVGDEIEIDAAEYCPNLHEKPEVRVRRSKPYIHEGPGEQESDGED